MLEVFSVLAGTILGYCLSLVGDWFKMRMNQAQLAIEVVERASDVVVK